MRESSSTQGHHLSIDCDNHFARNFIVGVTKTAPTNAIFMHPRLDHRGVMSISSSPISRRPVTKSDIMSPVLLSQVHSCQFFGDFKEISCLLVLRIAFR